MARIRSIHPGLFTDEEFMSLSMAAKAALPGIWTECDDAGMFEWKPIVLKARIFPADNVDMSAILDELAAANCLRRVELSGKPYGLVRNFRRWQRPEKPKYRQPLPDEYLSYVGLSPTNPLPVADQSPTDIRKSPQREEEGGRRKDVDGESNAGAREPLADLETQCREAAGWQNEPAPMLAVTGPVQALIDAGADLEVDVLPTIRALAPKCRRPSTWKYFLNAIAQARDDRIAAATIISPPTTAGASHGKTQRKSARSDFFRELRARLDADESGDQNGGGSDGITDGGEAIDRSRERAIPGGDDQGAVMAHSRRAGMADASS